METVQNINPTRVAWCLDQMRVSFEEAAQDSKVPESKIEAVLAGEPALTFAQLRRLATYLGRSVLFFLDPEPIVAEQVTSPQFRTLTGQKPELSRRVRQLVQRVEQQRRIYADLKAELSPDEPHVFAPPELSKDPIAAAKQVRHWLKLDGCNTFEKYRQAVERSGVLVFRTNGYVGSWQIAKESPVLGFALYDSKLPVIVVKKQTAESRQTFTLMHELGHILLHKQSSIDDEADMFARGGMEREANIFAAHVLVPSAFLEQIADPVRPDDVASFDEWLLTQRRRWGVSTDVILLQLVAAGRLPQVTYATYRQWKAEQPTPVEDGGSRAYRYREPRHIFGDSFVRVVLNALDSRQITLNKASDYLDGLKISDLHKLERQFASA